MVKLLTGLMLAVLLAACATGKMPYPAPVDTHYRVQINASFDAIPNATRIQFQGGARIQPGNLDKWTTYCKLFVYNRHRQADYLTSVTPGEFEITQVDLRYDSSDYVDRYWFRFASFDRHRHDPPAYYLYQVRMLLTSPDQPDVKSLTCYKKWATRGRYFPTLAEIRQALGSMIELRPLAIAE